MLYSCNTYYMYTFYYNVSPIIVVGYAYVQRTQKIKHKCRLVRVKSETIMGQVYPRVGLDCCVKNFPLLMNQVGKKLQKVC